MHALQTNCCAYTCLGLGLEHRLKKTEFSVPSPIAILIYTDGHNGEGQSSHVPVFCLNLELWGIIAFT